MPHLDAPTNNTFSTNATIPAPTQATPESAGRGSDPGSASSFRRDDDSFELRKTRKSDDGHFDREGYNPEDSSSEDEWEKEHIGPMRRVGTESKDFTDEEERVIIKKFDRKLVLFMALLYMLSFLDRSSRTPLSVRLVMSSVT